MGDNDMDCYIECGLRQNQTSNPYACSCQICKQRVNVLPTDNSQPLLTSHIPQCESCEHGNYCKFFSDPKNVAEDGSCYNYKPIQTIEQRRLERVWEEVEKHGGIQHLVGLDKLAMEGRLLVAEPHDFGKLSAELQKLYGQPGAFTVADYNALFKQVSSLHCLIQNMPQVLSDFPAVKAEFESIAPKNWNTLVQTACEVLLSGAKALALKNQAKASRE